MSSPLPQIHIPLPPNPTPEDIFSTSLFLISPETTPTLHGDPGSQLTYRSAQFGDIELQLAAPETEEDRKKFAQFLWNAGILMAGLLGERDGSGKIWGDGDSAGEGGGGDARSRDHNGTKARGLGGAVVGERVLELGAGTGLVGIVSALVGAQEVVISDYPSAEILTTIERNCAKNIPAFRPHSHSHSSRESGNVNGIVKVNNVRVIGHEWGKVAVADDRGDGDDFPITHAHHFTRILAADCLWMASEHRNLVMSMLHFLSRDEERARVWLVAGFHTGRAKIASFFEVAADAGLEVERIWERDMQGNEREWVEEASRRPEDITERKKWLVVAILRRA